jgi:hypothetical protein
MQVSLRNLLERSYLMRNFCHNLFTTKYFTKLHFIEMHFTREDFTRTGGVPPLVAGGPMGRLVVGLDGTEFEVGFGFGGKGPRDVGGFGLGPDVPPDFSVDPPKGKSIDV